MQKITSKTVVLVGVVLIFGFWGYHKFEHHREHVEEFVQFVHFNWTSNPAAAAASTPRVSELSIRVFADVDDGLLSGCANNQLGLTREDCVRTIHDRKDICRQQTIQKYPETPANATVLQEVISSHVSCIFRAPSAVGD